MEDRYERYAIYIIIIGIIIRFSLVIISYPSGDACWHLSVSEYIAKNGTIPLFENLGRAVFWSPPAFHIMNAMSFVFFSLFNMSAIGIKLLSPLAGSVFILMAFLITRKFFNSKIALFATIFVAFIPESIYSSAISYVDMLLGAFILCSIYFALDNKISLSFLFSILAIFTKYTGVLAVPVIILIIWYGNPRKKQFIKKAAPYIFVVFLIGSVWFIRNFVYLGNPIWPFLNSMIGGIPSDYETGNVANFLSVKPYRIFYLSLFGVPSGNISNLFAVNIPFLEVLLAIWFVGTLLFVAPLLFGIKKINLKDERWKILLLLLILFLLFGCVYIYNVQSLTSRLILPSFISLGVIWAFGIDWLITKFKGRYLTIAKYVFIAIILCLVAIEFFKAYYAGSQWTVYSSDFAWIKENTPEDSVFLISGDQCHSFNFERRVETLYESGVLDMKKIDKIGYVWVNNNMLPAKGDVYEEDTLEYFQNNMQLVYENNATGTRIYKK